MFAIIITIRIGSGQLIETWSFVTMIEYKELEILAVQGKIVSVLRIAD